MPARKKKARKRAPGGGRKPDDAAGVKVSLTVRVPPDVREHLTATGNASEEVTRLVRREIGN